MIEQLIRPISRREILIKGNTIAAYGLSGGEEWQYVLPGFNREFMINPRSIEDISIRLFGKTVLPVFSARGKGQARECNFVYTRTLNDQEIEQEDFRTWLTGALDERHPGKYEVVGPAIDFDTAKKKRKIVLNKKKVGLWLHDVEKCRRSR